MLTASPESVAKTQEDKLFIVLTSVGLPVDDFNPLTTSKGKDGRRTFSGENTEFDGELYSLPSFDGEYKTSCGPEDQRQALHIPKGLCALHHRIPLLRLV